MDPAGRRRGRTSTISGQARNAAVFGTTHDLIFVMTIHRKFLFGALLAVSALVPAATSEAQRIHISIGDRPYYTRGPYYWENDVRYVWVPGYRHRHGHWIRGHYAARGHRSPLQRLKKRHRAHRSLILGR